MRVNERIKYKQKKIYVYENKLKKKWYTKMMIHSVISEKSQEIAYEQNHLLLKYRDETTKN